MVKVKFFKGFLYGNATPADKTFYNDFDGLKAKYGDFSTIKDIKIKVIGINYDTIRIKGINWNYQITKNDNTIEIFEGINNQEGVELLNI